MKPVDYITKKKNEVREEEIMLSHVPADFPVYMCIQKMVLCEPVPSYEDVGRVLHELRMFMKSRMIPGVESFSLKLTSYYPSEFSGGECLCLNYSYIKKKMGKVVYSMGIIIPCYDASATLEKVSRGKCEIVTRKKDPEVIREVVCSLNDEGEEK